MPHLKVRREDLVILLDDLINQLLAVLLRLGLEVLWDVYLVKLKGGVMDRGGEVGRETRT